MATHSSRKSCITCFRRWSLAVLAALICVTALASNAQAQFAGARREYPPQDYYLALNIYQAGEFQDAAKAFNSAARSGIRTSEGRSIDSVCYHTMLGECFYEMGELGQALDEYTKALNLFMAYNKWLLTVEFPERLDPANPGGRNRPTWGVSTRRAVPARFPDSYQILQVGSDLNKLAVEGGTLTLPEIYLVNAHEIMRCTAIAIRRRHEIMGLAASHDPLTQQLVTTLSSGLTRPGHWSGAWVETLLGLAYASYGRPAEAQAALTKSVTIISSQYDHPLTGTALLALGKLEFERGQYAKASQLFLEASLSAAWFSQYALIEESLRWGATTHMVTGQAGMYAPLDAAAAWARRESDFMFTSVTVSAAEVAATANALPAATTLLEQARRSMVRADMRGGAVGARYQYALALTNFAGGNIKAGDAAFAALMTYQRKGSFRLFELNLIDRLVASGTLTGRVGLQLYEYALREPDAKDWSVAPVETLSVVLTPHLPAFEHWFELALKRNQDERAIEISDMIRRHRFFTTLPMGGRLVALRWVLEAPPEAITKSAKLQRQDLLARYPNYAALSGEASAIRKQLDSAPLVSEDTDAKLLQKKLMTKLAQLGAAQEAILREIALRRVPADFVFPPPLDLKAYQNSLPPNTVAISYLATGRAIHVFTIGNESYKLGMIEGGTKLRKGIADMLRAMGHYDKNQPVDVEVLASSDWKGPAREMFAAMMPNRKASDFDEIDELIVIPDGALWYLPFEALQLGDAGVSVPLIAKTRLRYAPTISLSQYDGRASLSAGAETATVVGSLFPRDDEKIGLAAFAELKASLPEATSFSTPLTIPSKMLAPFCDRLVVLTDIQGESKSPYGWAPMQLDHGKAGSTLSEWAMLPFGSPDQIVLPGFHTEAETALKRPAGGEDVFLSLCGLMASGSRTILLSRWRTGGKSSYDLTREFVQELPYTSPTEAWQRSVFLGMSSELDLTREPRVKAGNMDASIRADHPFFWSSYLLVTPGPAITNANADKKNEAVARKK